MGLSFYTFDIVYLLSVFTIIGQCIAVIVFALFLQTIMRRAPYGRLLVWVRNHSILLMLIVAVTAVSGSLFFSEIAQWTPCKDCWLQRIVMYPQVVLLAIALWKKDQKIAIYILALCLIGIGLSTDHYLDQLEAHLYPIADKEGVNILLKPCDATGVSCAATQIDFYFGYITIPMMALTGFVLNALGSLLLLFPRASKNR